MIEDGVPELPDDILAASRLARDEAKRILDESRGLLKETVSTAIRLDDVGSALRTSDTPDAAEQNVA